MQNLLATTGACFRTLLYLNWREMSSMGTTPIRLLSRPVLAVEARGMTAVTMHITPCLRYGCSAQTALLRTARANFPKGLSATLSSVEGRW